MHPKQIDRHIVGRGNKVWALLGGWGDAQVPTEIVFKGLMSYNGFYYETPEEPNGECGNEAVFSATKDGLIDCLIEHQRYHIAQHQKSIDKFEAMR